PGATRGLQHHRLPRRLPTMRATARRSRTSLTGGHVMAATERVPHPDDPEFAPIRADLGRLFIKHKRELSMIAWSDEAIIAKTNDICATLIALGKLARANGDTTWLLRHRWFFAATA